MVGPPNNAKIPILAPPLRAGAAEGRHVAAWLCPSFWWRIDLVSFLFFVVVASAATAPCKAALLPMRAFSEISLVASHEITIM